MILDDIKAESIMQRVWDNYVAENKYIGELSLRRENEDGIYVEHADITDK